MINQMQHAAATANMYASAGMYDPVTLNPYANGTYKIIFFDEPIRNDVDYIRYRPYDMVR